MLSSLTVVEAHRTSPSTSPPQRQQGTQRYDSSQPLSGGSSQPSLPAPSSFLTIVSSQPSQIADSQNSSFLGGEATEPTQDVPEAQRDPYQIQARKADDFGEIDESQLTYLAERYEDNAVAEANPPKYSASWKGRGKQASEGLQAYTGRRAYEGFQIAQLRVKQWEALDYLIWKARDVILIAKTSKAS